MKYRPEINGLRAISVTVVIFFHAGFDFLSGGYVGVDVFFVISGFLITTIITQDISDQNFSILHFYERRARRILPALVVVLSVCIPFAWAWMTPWQLAAFNRALMATCGFASNILFAYKADYFAPSAELNPLLHTWSLAVEEQFYVLFPLMMFGARNWSRRSLIALILVISALSLAAAVTLSFLGEYVAGNFYLLPTRAWELGAGALLSLMHDRFATAPERIKSQLACLGVAMILLSAILFTKQTPFPSFWTVIPVLGSLLVIAFSSQGNSTGRILSAAPLVTIGLVSYSAYLWHQPLLAFSRLRRMGQPEQAEILILIAFSFILAYLTWQFVERPFREKLYRQYPSRRIVAFSAIPLAALIAAGMLLDNREQYESRFPQEVRRVFSFINYREHPAYAQQFRRGLCFISGQARGEVFDFEKCLPLEEGRPNYVLLGDSHAAHLWRALSEAFPQVNVLQATASGCKPLLNTAGASGCTKIRDRVFNDVVKRSGITGIIMAARWAKGDVELLLKTVEYLHTLNIKVIVIGPTIEYTGDFPEILGMSIYNSNPMLVQDRLVAEKFTLSELIGERLTGSGAQYVPVTRLLCAAHDCRTYSSVDEPMQFDYGHLTLSGSRDLVNVMMTNSANPLVLR